MQSLEVSGAVRPLYGSLGVKGLNSITWHLLIRVAAPSKASVCGRCLPGTVGSIPAGSMEVCPLWVLCVVR